MRWQYNDNELLYLISEKEDSALKMLFMKYYPLIGKRITEQKVPQKEFDDFFQEGLIMLKKAIETFNPMKGKTFNKYFDLILQRRFDRLVEKMYEYSYNVSILEKVDILFLKETNNFFGLDELYTGDLSKNELNIMKMIYEENKTPKDISEELGCSIRSVYNTTSRAKKKIRKSNNL